MTAVETYPSTQAMAEAAAAGIARQLDQGLKTRGRASLVATGGRSPGPVYDALHGAHIDWSRVVVTVSDERCVAPTDPASNEKLVRERLLTGEPGKAHYIPLWPLPEDAALEALAPFDAVMLGMGEDGHIASLLPRAPNLAEGMDPASGRLTFSVPEGVGNPPLPRTSLTLPALLRAKAIFILIAGDAKRDVIAQASAGADYPVRALLTQGQVPVRILWSPTH